MEAIAWLGGWLEAIASRLRSLAVQPRSFAFVVALQILSLPKRYWLQGVLQHSGCVLCAVGTTQGDLVEGKFQSLWFWVKLTRGLALCSSFHVPQFVNKKLVGTSASLLVTSDLLLVTRSYYFSIVSNPTAIIRSHLWPGGG